MLHHSTAAASSPSVAAQGQVWKDIRSKNRVLYTDLLKRHLMNKHGFAALIDKEGRREERESIENLWQIHQL
jgi:hypothetical protein